MDRTQRDGLLLLLLSALGYSFLPVIANWLETTGIAPLDVVIWRYIFATLLIWLIIVARRAPPPVKPLPRLSLLMAGLFFALAALAAFFGLRLIPAGMFVVLFYTYPAFVVLLSIPLGERLPRLGWFALLLTLIGVALMTPDFFALLQPNNLFSTLPMIPASIAPESNTFGGVVLALANALIVAVSFLLINRVLRGHKTSARASAWEITGALVFLLILVFLRGLILPPSPLAWVLLMLLASVSTVMPIFALTAGIQKFGASRAAIVSTIEPLMSVALAALLLGEALLPVQLLGGAFILLSVILLQIKRSPPPAWLFKQRVSSSTSASPETLGL